MKTLLELAKEEQLKTKDTIILAKVDGKLSELNNWAIEDQNVEFITTATVLGNEAYRRSVLFMMLYAIHRIAPDIPGKDVNVQYSLSKGLFCEIKNDACAVNQEFIDKVKQIMCETVAKDVPIIKHVMHTDQAVKVMLSVFDIFLYEDGFALQMPVPSSPEEVPQFRPQKKLFGVLKESSEWDDILDLDTVGALNDAIAGGRMKEIKLGKDAWHVYGWRT